ncbi:hypothetical protein LIER_27421 [Lithospermum erythrorhizon]|uniref:S-protein homolog n=1 Tax=Lithospermum erythrorhizon TaxID=34254 RepID=A0AAV3RC02_LITER
MSHISNLVPSMWFIMALLTLNYCPQSSMAGITNYTMKVVNNLSTDNYPLRVNCSSDVTYVGYHELHVNQNFYFIFGEDINDHVQKYYCAFRIGDEGNTFVRAAGFRIFDETTISSCDNNHQNCYWAAKDDGFYLATSPGVLTKKQLWSGGSFNL